MVQLNAKEVKDKIISYLNTVGPSLPIPIAKNLNMSTLFASAFLSEFASDGAVKISCMKVGGSPLYFTSEKESMLENFTRFLGQKEREACLLLKEKGVLQDDTQHPAIRVALRSIKDFAIPFKKDGKIFWRYFTLKESEIIIPEIKEEVKTPETPVTPEVIEEKRDLNKVEQELIEKQRQLEDAKKEISELKSKANDNKIEVLKKPNKKTKQRGANFLDEIADLLLKKNIEIINVEQADKKQAFARIRVNKEEYLLAAFNKKKIDDTDILKAYKKSITLGLPYYVLSKGDPSKKTQDIINAYKKLASIENISSKQENPEQ